MDDTSPLPPVNKLKFFSVFANFLGDTILMDDLDSANNYRRSVSDAH